MFLFSDTTSQTHIMSPTGTLCTPGLYDRFWTGLVGQHDPSPDVVLGGFVDTVTRFLVLLEHVHRLIECFHISTDVHL